MSPAGPGSDGPTHDGQVVHLVERRPDLGADELAARFVPPHRFATATFASYEPDPAHPSQAAARAAIEEVAADLAAAGGADGRRRWGRRRRPPEGPAGLYLDGGFGVGKTHLLAALCHAVGPGAAFLTFAELAATVGFVGMDEAVRAFGRLRLLCIDEFELDDVANTLMTVTFLRAVLPRTRVVATSNAVPDRLGEGRFNADDFRREIAAIAAHFTVRRVDGPDYRARARSQAEALPDEVAEPWVAAEVAAGRTVAVDDAVAVLGHLRRVHPVQVPALFDGVDVVVLRDLHTIDNQGDALLFVHLVDELYDSGLLVGATGCRVDELFSPSFRVGGYRKKYGRCESRLAALLGEAAEAASTTVPGPRLLNDT